MVIQLLIRKKGNALESIYSNFKKQINNGDMKSVNELFEYLNSRFILKEFSINKMSKSFIEAEEYNARHMFDSFIEDSDLKLHVFQIVKNEESSIYFSKELTAYSSLNFGHKDDLLLFMYEEKTNYFFINNSTLFSELIVQRGVSKNSIKDRDILYLEFESCKKFIKEIKKRNI